MPVAPRFSEVPRHFLLVRARTWSRSEAGVALLEVLVTAVVVGIAAIGITFMFSFGNTWVVAKGDDRVALSLAQKQIEQLRAGVYSALAVGRTPASGMNCVTPSGSACGPSSDRKFNWIYCVEYVQDTNVSNPAYAGVSPTFSSCNATPPSPLPNTKRITVAVQPAQSANPLYADPPVILQAWITNIPGGI